MRSYSISKQSGVTMLFVLVFLFGLFLAIAWATDSGNWLLMKTREQNAIDAIALSAAIALNADPNFSTSVAQTAGRETCELFQQSIGNGGLTDIDCQSAAELTFEFSKYLIDPDTGGWNPGTSPARFVRVESSALIAEPILIQMMSGFEGGQTINSVATAGAVGQNCNVQPFVMCAEMPIYDATKYDADSDNYPKPDPDDPTKPEDGEWCLNEANINKEYCQPLDSNCELEAVDTDGNPKCFGYTIGEINSLTEGCFQQNANNTDCPPESLDAGNYNLLNLEGLSNQGVDAIRDTITSEEGVQLASCLNRILDTKPGNSVSIINAINERYDSDDDKTSYSGWSGDVSPYTDYTNNGNGNDRRVMATFFGDCRGNQNGNSLLPKVGNACVFLTQYADGPPTPKIYAEFAYNCPQYGEFSPLHSELLGPFKVVLFKSEGSQDS